MERESQQSLINAQLEHDRRMRTIDRLRDLIVQGAKGLSVLNAGAVVAMLAFVQALFGKSAYPAFKPYALSALSCFLLGAFLATIVFFFHHKYISRVFHDAGRQEIWNRVIWGLLIASSVCAFVGGGIVTIGICIAV